jgi:hypothetical protein
MRISRGVIALGCDCERPRLTGQRLEIESEEHDKKRIQDMVKRKA